MEEFLDGLSDDDAADEAQTLIEMLEEHGNKLRRPFSAPLGNGLFEARGLTSGVRLFFVYAPGHRIIVLDGYVKKRSRIPVSIMTRMRKLQKDTERALRNEGIKNRETPERESATNTNRRHDDKAKRDK